jgi:hypothetical protein
MFSVVMRGKFCIFVIAELHVFCYFAKLILLLTAGVDFGIGHFCYNLSIYQRVMFIIIWVMRKQKGKFCIENNISYKPLSSHIRCETS